MINPIIKEAVKELYVDKGYNVVEVAEYTGVNASTIHEWINMSDWKDERINKQFKLSKEQLAAIPVKVNNLTLLKALVKGLILEKGYTQKQASQEAKVSEKTVSKWVNQYKWEPKNII